MYSKLQRMHCRQTHIPRQVSSQDIAPQQFGIRWLISKGCLGPTLFWIFCLLVIISTGFSMNPFFKVIWDITSLLSFSLLKCIILYQANKPTLSAEIWGGGRCSLWLFPRAIHRQGLWCYTYFIVLFLLSGYVPTNCLASHCHRF